jgi:hypothetical protein
LRDPRIKAARRPHVPCTEAFHDAGFTVVLFDFRHFGASISEPRQLLNIGRQQDDYRAAVVVGPQALRNRSRPNRAVG